MAKSFTPAHEVRAYMRDQLDTARYADQGITESESTGDIMGIENRCRWLEQLTYFAPTQHGEQDVLTVEVDHQSGAFEIKTRRSVLRASDPEDIQTLIGFGCAMEHFCQAASALGLEVIEEETTLSTDMEDDNLACLKGKLSYVSDGIDADRLRMLIDRRSVRGPHASVEGYFGEDELASSEEGITPLEYFTRQIADMGGIPITDPETIKMLTKFSEEGYLVKMGAKQFVMELLDMVLRPGEEKTAEKGMIPELFGLPTLPPRNLIPLDKLAAMMGLATKKLAKDEAAKFSKTVGLLVFTANPSNPLEVINAGRASIQAWLLAQQAGYDIHPNAIFVEHEPVRKALRGMLDLQGRQYPVFVVRIGKTVPKERTNPEITPPKKVVKGIKPS